VVSRHCGHTKIFCGQYFVVTAAISLQPLAYLYLSDISDPVGLWLILLVCLVRPPSYKLR
jgi:hypothetical protein